MLRYICSVILLYLSAAGCGKISNWMGGDTYCPIGEKCSIDWAVPGYATTRKLEDIFFFLPLLKIKCLNRAYSEEKTEN